MITSDPMRRDGAAEAMAEAQAICLALETFSTRYPRARHLAQLIATVRAQARVAERERCIAALPKAGCACRAYIRALHTDAPDARVDRRCLKQWPIFVQTGEGYAKPMFTTACQRAEGHSGECDDAPGDDGPDGRER